jgi:hypothetical protein
MNTYDPSLGFLPELTAQMIFDMTMDHLVKQKEIAGDGEQCFCRYEKEDGKILKCALGYWIPDYFYDENMENKAIEGIFELFKFPFNYKSYVELFTRLQHFHDNDFKVDSVTGKLDISSIYSIYNFVEVWNVNKPYDPIDVSKFNEKYEIEGVLADATQAPE